MKPDNQNILFSLLRSALWGDPFKDEVPGESFSQVIELAKEQTVVGLVFDVLKEVKNDSRQNRTLIFRTIKLTERIKTQNLTINKELCSFSQKSEKAGLTYLVVKGQTLGRLYANPLLRSSGDIDFLVPDISSNLSDVFPDVQFPKVMKEKELDFKFNNITYELHTRLTDFGCKKHQRFWEELISQEWEKDFNVEIDGVKVRTMSPTMNAVYLFVHLYFHLIREGVSLRQFCDWAMMLHHYQNEIDRTHLCEILEQLDMIKGYKAFGCILVDELGLPEDEFPISLAEEDRRLKDKILEDIFQGGNFGKKNHKSKSAFGFKLETLRMAVRNSIRYYSLAPSEMRMMIPKMIKINMKLLIN